MPACDTCGAWKSIDAIVLVDEGDGRSVFRCRACQHPPSETLLTEQAKARARFRP